VTRAAVLREVYTTAIALLFACAAGSLLILAFGQSPARVYGLLLSRTWLDAHGFGQVLFKTTPLIFTGLAVALAFRAGLFNIGAEGQMTAGAFATAVAGASLPLSTPWPIAVPLAVAAGLAAGALVGAIPGALRAYTGAHEVINTIMLNFITLSLVLWAGRRWFYLGETTHTRAVVPGAELSALGLARSAANSSVFLALGAAVLVWLFLSRTRRGYELRALGHSAAAAEAAGVNVRATIIGAMAASGAIAGLVGANFVLGYKHYFENEMGRGVGFMGIAVALLGRSHPLGVVAAALLFGTLSQGGLEVSSLVPRELVDVLQAVIILAVAATSAEVGRIWRREGGAR
jgi:general nucleoside transport system permease protein